MKPDLSLMEMVRWDLALHQARSEAAPFSGPLASLAHVMTSYVVSAEKNGKIPTIKELVPLVAPKWMSVASAHRLVKLLHDAQYFLLEPSTRDARVTCVRSTKKLSDDSNRIMNRALTIFGR